MNDVLANILLVLVCLTPFGIGGLVVLGIVYLIYSTSNKRRKVNVDVKVLTGATPAKVEMSTLEPMPFAGWDLTVQGNATVLVGEGLVVTGPIVSLQPEAAVYANKAFGRVEMGKVPGAGYTQWTYREAKNGVVNPVYTIINKHLYFGLFLTKRPFTRKGGKAQKLADFPGGFGDQGDKSLEDAFDRELAEEANLQRVVRVPMVTPDGQKLPGSVMNRAFFADDDDANTQMYRAISVDPASLKANGDGTYTIEVEYTPEEPGKDDKSPAATAKKKAIGATKQLISVTFYPVEQVALWVRDGIVGFGVLRVIGMWLSGWLPEQQTAATVVDHSKLVGVDA